MAYNFKDLTGQKFNRLTVIRRDENCPGGRVKWLCRCDCGKEISVDGACLKNENTRSCGCIRLNDLSGKRFGILTVIERVENLKYRTTLWRCRCDCGKITISQAQALTRGRSKSCGCNRAEDIVGRKFNKLTVIRRDISNPHNTMWICRCDCGRETRIDRGDLMKGAQKGCGCERTKQNRNTLNPLWQTHVMIIERCTNPKCNSYGRYGAAGVTVCDRWLNSFTDFVDDMGPKPTPEHTIDRYPNQKGNYEPGNCRWATKEEQARNRKDNVNLTYNGKTQCVSAWSIETGLKKGTISSRLRLGWSVENTLTTPTRKKECKA